MGHTLVCRFCLDKGPERTHRVQAVIREGGADEHGDRDLFQLGRLGLPEVVIQGVILQVVRGDAPLGLHEVLLRAVDGRLPFGKLSFRYSTKQVLEFARFMDFLYERQVKRLGDLQKVVIIRSVCESS